MKKVKEVIGLETVEKNKTVTVEKEEEYSPRRAGLQTVKTSMRGILKSNEKAPQRKKLLGE